ncbi:bifunctional adenosylcobinamide kinase/adenosylcobinamide-phosphate guanylyltransferase [Puniceibacterium sediminis]|uniref:Bifunctional adenosylcobalamin biosynthesis protein n=1 Tax=Puniceibacterium sediminis TaxID=1608407 RepID=A0A238Z338_9RHOB|nr:bifunctional adenosylcobinamide kinase/adenosylcobinamide-phosphate guanylyltransferase [Puniceibacterium sediminis]SNR77361.1 adenosylcobinamide kinase /adenosylcobinamide-phosphate guanylyltransferase [Puniceibacterium sediminis]
MRTLALVTGGAKSGKSRFAEGLVRGIGDRLVYIATAEALDSEMEERIAAHLVQRGAGWHTVEEPLDLCGALVRSDGQGPRLVDCMTLWLSNLMMQDRNVDAELDALLETLTAQVSPVVMVTNEVGSGIVPATALGRVYRDRCGAMNQRLGAVVDRIDLVVCGHPLRVK